MEIFRGGRVPELVDGWAAALRVPCYPSQASRHRDRVSGWPGFYLLAAAWRAQAPWLRGVLGEWKVRRLLRRHCRGDARPPSAAARRCWLDPVDHLVRLPDRILVLETKNLGGRLTGAERDACWTQALAAGGFQIQIRSCRMRFISPRSVPPPAARCACRAWCCSSVGAGSMIGCPWAAIGRVRSHDTLRELQRADRFGPTWESRVAGAWERIREATSTRLYRPPAPRCRDRSWRGRRPRLAPGLGLALAAGALLGLFLAG